MRNYFKYEFKRSFFSKESYLGMSIIILCLIIPYIDEKQIPYPEADSLIYFIRIRTSLLTSYLPLIAPLIACIPSSTKYITDKQSGVLNIIFMKITRKEYFKLHVIINSITSGLVVLIPQIIVLIFLLVMYGVNNTQMDVFGAGSALFYSSKILYVILLLGISFISSAVFSTLALGISAVVENKYLTILIPFVYIIISGTIFEIIGINKLFSLNVMALFDMGFNGNLTMINIFIYELGLLILGASLFKFFGEKKNYE